MSYEDGVSDEEEEGYNEGYIKGREDMKKEILSEIESYMNDLIKAVDRIR